MVKKFTSSLIATVLKTFDYQGRASRFEYWTFAITVFLLNVVFMGTIVLFSLISDVLALALFCPFCTILLAELVIGISLSVRRLHDVGLSGFWLVYLSAIGLPVIYIAHLLNLDSSCDKIIERNQKIGSCWLGWILTVLAWLSGASLIVLLLIFLYNSQKGVNEYGPNPYDA